MSDEDDGRREQLRPMRDRLDDLLYVILARGLARPLAQFLGVLAILLFVTSAMLGIGTGIGPFGEPHVFAPDAGAARGFLIAAAVTFAASLAVVAFPGKRVVIPPRTRQPVGATVPAAAPDALRDDVALGDDVVYAPRTLLSTFPFEMGVGLVLA